MFFVDILLVLCWFPSVLGLSRGRFQPQDIPKRMRGEELIFLVVQKCHLQAGGEGGRWRAARGILDIAQAEDHLRDLLAQDCFEGGPGGAKCHASKMPGRAIHAPLARIGVSPGT